MNAAISPQNSNSESDRCLRLRASKRIMQPVKQTAGQMTTAMTHNFGVADQSKPSPLVA